MTIELKINCKASQAIFMCCHIKACSKGLKEKVKLNNEKLTLQENVKLNNEKSN